MKGQSTMSFLEQPPPSSIKDNFLSHLSLKSRYDHIRLTKDILRYFFMVPVLWDSFRKIFKHFPFYRQHKKKHQIKMIDYIKKPPMAIFTVSTSFGKSIFVLEYNKYYDYIIFITVQHFDRTIKIKVESEMMTMFG